MIIFRAPCELCSSPCNEKNAVMIVDTNGRENSQLFCEKCWYGLEKDEMKSFKDMFEEEGKTILYPSKQEGICL